MPSAASAWEHTAMTFEDWMTYRGLSQSSVEKYSGAIKGPLSTWAIDNGLMAGPLTSLTSQLAFSQIASQIHSLPVFQARNARGHNMYSSALSKFSDYLSEGYGSDIESDIDTIFEDEDISKTEKINLVMSRIGQGAFRQKVLSYWTACAVTGFKDTSLLIASHIKPWRASNNYERLNPFNGLLLAPNLDRTFDAGLITFEPDGSIKLSPLLTEPEKLGIVPKMRVSLTSGHEPFMDFHRDFVYRAT